LLELLYLFLHLRGGDQVSPDQDTSCNQADNNQYDRKLDQGKAARNRTQGATAG
jgi:hypothetical protein